MTYNKDSEHDFTAAPKGVDGAVGLSDRKWFVAIVNPRHEKKVAEKLLKINIESYVASQKEIHVWANGRRRLIDRVVISSMVFVRCTEQERRHLVTLPYIHRFLVNRSAAADGMNKPAAVIVDKEMETLKFMLGNSETPVEFAPMEFHVKDNVRVVRGSLRGLEGEIRENSDGTHTLVVGFPILGGATVFIQPQDVEKI